MKTYSIGKAAEKVNLTSYTLRYYDKEGLLPFVERTPSGTRVFKESDIGALKVIECLKATGMPIKEIRTFIDWCVAGDSSLQERHDMFMERKETVAAQIAELQKAQELIEHKCHYYQTALEAGTESIHQSDKIEIAPH